MTIAETVKKCLANQACKPIEEITAEHTLGALHLDSLDMVEVAIEIENALNALWPDSDLSRGVETFPDMTVQAYIEEVEKYVESVKAGSDVH